MATKDTSALYRLKTITSHAGHARFLAECDEQIIGVIPRRPEIPSPYSYSPTWTVYGWEGKCVIVVETRHKRYEVFQVTGPILPVPAEEN